MGPLRDIWIGCLLLTTNACFLILADEPPVAANKGTEVVLLLDASQSMNTHDKGRLAIDAGLDQLKAQLETVRDTGYTNAGEGLCLAVGLFS